jgi:hypothetical protein
MGVRGLPRTWRHMNGYGSHTYVWINAAREKFWVKYHFHTEQGMAFFSNDEASAMSGADADFHRRDLFQAIARGEHPRSVLSVTSDIADATFLDRDELRHLGAAQFGRQTTEHHSELLGKACPNGRVACRIYNHRFKFTESIAGSGPC